MFNDVRNHDFLLTYLTPPTVAEIHSVANHVPNVVGIWKPKRRLRAQIVMMGPTMMRATISAISARTRTTVAASDELSELIFVFVY